MLENFVQDFDAFSNSWWPYTIAFLISVVSAIRLFVGGAQYQNSQRLDGKIVIVTGSSSGIGFETAKNLAARGAHVILAVRNAEKGKRAMSEIQQLDTRAKLTVKLLDISEMTSIKDFVAEIKTEFGKVDVLINNAGVIYQPYRRTIDGHELTLVINYLGPFLLTHLLLPLLNASENGRIINVSAMAHFHGNLKLEDLNMEKNFNEKDAYAQSKLALTVFTKYLASLLSKTKITCNSVSPGLVRGTGHLKNLPLHKSVWTKFSVWPWMWLFLKTPKQGCQTIVYLAVEPTLNNVSGHYFSDCEIKEPADQVKDVHLAQALYERSCTFVNIDGKQIIDSLLNEEVSTTKDESGDSDDCF